MAGPVTDSRKLKGSEAYNPQHQVMISEHLLSRGIMDKQVVRAMREVPRERFIDNGMATLAYEDHPLPIGEGQTISQPYIVAYMTEALELSNTDRVLEIGTGSGYAAAILSQIADTVHTVERLGGLAQSVGYRNIVIHEGDGTLGWPEQAPYDAIVVTACAPEVPRPLLDQLVIGGRLVIPVGVSPRLQTLFRVRRVGESDFHTEELCGVCFVPLVGAAGWRE